MYKLLIVDDEPWLRKRLLLTIDWQSMGITELFEAEDGAKAFNLAVKHEPDIIITDIEMPELSGIDLMQTLNESALFPQIILISGYNEFEYARSAVKFGAVDYLLKPVSEDELKQTVTKCIATLEQNRYNKEIRDLLVNSSSLLREKIYVDLLQGKLDFNKVPSTRLYELGVTFLSSSAMCVIAHSHPANHTLSGNDVEQTLVNLSIHKIIKEFLASCFGVVLDFWVDDVNVYLVFSDLSAEEFKAGVAKALSHAKKQICKLHSVRIAYGTGSIAFSLAELSTSYRKARYSINLCRSKLHSAYGGEEETKANDFQIVYDEYNLRSLIMSLRSGNADEASKLLTELINEFLNQSDGAPSSLQIKLMYINVLNSLFKGCLPSLPVSEDIIKICVDYIDASASFHTTDKMHSQLQSLLSVLTQQYHDFFGTKRHWLIDKIMEYINVNYASSLSMRDVAANFHLNPSYFCKLFKEEIGVTFTTYLMSKRVENAKRLMSESTMKLYDVASAVGYTNVQYFSTVFKEIEGITPSQFRSGIVN